MARFRVRPVYGADEENPGERIERGVSGAIGQYLGQRDSEKNFRNQVRQTDPNATFEQAPSGWEKTMNHFGRTGFFRRMQGAGGGGPAPADQVPAAGAPGGMPRMAPGAPGGIVATPRPAPIPRSTIEGPGGMTGIYDPDAAARRQAGIAIGQRHAELELEQPYKLEQIKAQRDPQAEANLYRTLLENQRFNIRERNEDRRSKDSRDAMAPSRDASTAESGERAGQIAETRRATAARRYIEGLSQHTGQTPTADQIRANLPNGMDERDALAALSEFGDSALPSPNRRRTAPVQPLTQADYDRYLDAGFSDADIARSRDVSRVRRDSTRNR